MPITVRQAEVGDYGVFARLFPELGTDAPLPSTSTWQAEMQATTVIAELDGCAAGYAFFALLQGTGYVRHIVTAPERRRAGVGRALMAELRRRFVGAGATSWCLNVKPDNLPALLLYESFGLRRAYRSTALRFPWTLVDRLAPVSDVVAGPIAERDDAAVEAALGLLAGQLADARRRGRVLVQVRRGEAILGAAVFEPGFPGAFPFRVSSPEIAGPLLETLRPRALPEHRLMQIVAEDDYQLTALLLASGAEARLETLHYRGSLWARSGAARLAGAR